MTSRDAGVAPIRAPADSYRPGEVSVSGRTAQEASRTGEVGGGPRQLQEETGPRWHCFGQYNMDRDWAVIMSCRARGQMSELPPQLKSEGV